MFDNKDYEDIIELPHHVSTSRPRMSMHDRAAQFSPFAALTGHGAAIAETARLTDSFQELDEGMTERLDQKIRIIREKKDQENPVVITYFLPDKEKTGGKYISAEGRVKKVDEYHNIIVMSDGTRIPMERIIEIESSLFDEFI